MRRCLVELLLGIKEALYRAGQAAGVERAVILFQTSFFFWVKEGLSQCHSGRAGAPFLDVEARTLIDCAEPHLFLSFLTDVRLAHSCEARASKRANFF